MQRDLTRLLRPRSVAVLGGRWADEVIQQCLDVGFDGELWRVHGRAQPQPAGVAQFLSVSALPAAPDAVFLGISAAATVDVVSELAEAGAGGVVCFAAGFAESAEDGADQGMVRQQALLKAAGNMPVLGPNCYGFLNYLDGVALWPDQQPAVRVDRGVALISQSGNLAVNLTFQQRGLPFAYLISAGNQVQLSITDLINAMLDDPRVTVIGLYLEGITDGAAFVAAIHRAAQQRIPIVVIKAGRTAAAAATAAGHTASLSGDDAVFDAFCQRYGVARVGNMAELVETLKVLHVCGPLPGRRVATLSCSGGEAVMVSDIGEPLGLEFPPLPDHTQVALRQVLGPRVHLSNPIDYHTYIWADEQAMSDCYAAVLAAGYDAVALLLDMPDPERYDLSAWQAAPAAVVSAVTRVRAQHDRPIHMTVIANLSENMPPGLRERLFENDVVPLQGLPEGLAALAHAGYIGERWAVRCQYPDARANTDSAVEVSLTDELSVKRWLAAADVPVPLGARVALADVAAACASMRMPIVVKTAAALAHKTEAGGVVLGVRTVADAVSVATRLQALHSDVLVEEMVGDVVAELLVTVRVDPTFGAVLILAAGGIFVELIGTAQTRLLPQSDAQIEQQLAALPVWKLLRGFRGAQAADCARVVAVIQSIVCAASSLGERLVELEINPLMITSSEAVVVDAVLRLRD